LRILVPLDFSPATPRVLDSTLKLARATKASVWLLHVATPDPAFVGYQAGSDSVRDQVAHEYREEHRTLQSHADDLRAAGIEAIALLLRGATAQVILAEAERLHADLIVMATHGHSAVFNLIVGSVSQAVLRASPVPVLVVPARH
jgi:nucleotide-binding universal stress UspA family protein